MSVAVLILSALLAVVTLLLVHGLLRDRRRRRALERWGSGRGLWTERSAAGASATRRATSVREELGRLPSMTARKRHSFTHVLRSADQIVCDWRIVDGPKERPRHVPQTLVAFRHEGVELPSFRHRLELPEEWVVEGGGGWVACYLARRRIPAQELDGFVERARALVDQVLAERA